MTNSWRVVALALVLVVGIVAPIGLAGQSAAASSDCSNTVIYDEFRFNDDVVSSAANGSATVSAQNTDVTVEQATGFVRLDAKNPNGYCVEYHVRLNESIVAPAELGRVSSNDGNYTAEWHAVRDFEREETYTEVVFTLPAGSQAMFAPSKLRVETLSWTGTAKSEGSGLWHDLTGWIGDDEEEEATLDKRKYTFEATNSTDRVTVSLKDQESGKTIDEWDAMYRTNNRSGWQPVSTDSSAPVFYRKIDDSRIEFVFNDPTGEVRFTANPTTWDDVSSSWDSYWSGVDILDGTLEGLFGD